jgi:hypothetical protein
MRNRLGLAFPAQLAEQIADVLLDRRRRDHRLGGDLLVRGPGNEQSCAVAYRHEHHLACVQQEFDRERVGVLYCAHVKKVPH